jgi:hypothetical protein
VYSTADAQSGAWTPASSSWASGSSLPAAAIGITRRIPNRTSGAIRKYAAGPNGNQPMATASAGRVRRWAGGIRFISLQSAAKEAGTARGSARTLRCTLQTPRRSRRKRPSGTGRSTGVGVQMTSGSFEGGFGSGPIVWR